MRPSSAKAKGRRLQQHVRDRIREVFNLPDDDVRSTSMGASGVDILLSAAAGEKFPFDVECKNVERLNIWAAMEQAERDSEGKYPLLVFTRNRTETYCALRFEDLLKLLS